MVIRKMMPLWIWGVSAVIFFALSIGINAVYATYTVHNTVKNECSALEYLIQHPTRHNSNASVFFNDVRVWAHRDGCS